MSQKPVEVAPAPVSAPIAVAKLSRDVPTPFSIELDAEALPDVARYLGVLSLGDVALSGELFALDATGWQAVGHLHAIVEQSCVVTLAPVLQEIDQEVLRRYIPSTEIAEEVEIVVTEDEDGPDPFEDEIDIGALLLEEIALALDPYPRAKGAALETQVFAAPGVKPMTDEDARPFAKLAALKDKLQRPG
ncbi:MAG: YceD family protein [Pseudomonadota bacterium]